VKAAPRLAVGAFSAAAVAIMLGLGASAAMAQDAPVAKINGRIITETDIKLADAEIGSELAQVPESARKRILLEYLIENQIFSEAAEAAKLATGPAFEARMTYWRNRALRDLYFETSIRGSVKDADAKAFYDEQVKKIKPETEVSARHILVETKEKADEIAAKLKGGGDFAQLAKENSKDPGSKDNGGELGFFGRGQMVPQFEEAAFKLAKGEVSAPVQSQFGWHVIRLDDTRERGAPAFETVKDRILASLFHQKAQAVGTELRSKAKIEYLDADIKKAVEAEKAAPEQKKQ
jgi:peptidyl-prolyl cis-trans isomerase C